MVDKKEIESINESLTQIKSLLILQLLKDGTTTDQIETALKVKKIFPSNIKASFPIKKLKKKNG